MKRAVIGIDVGGTKTLMALCNDKFRVIAEFKFKTHPDKNEKHFTGQLDEGLAHLRITLKKSGLQLVGVGIGCAGYMDPQKGTVKTSPNIPFLKGFSFAKWLARHSDAPFVLGNDVQMGLYGEHALGAAKGAPHVLGIFFGTGIGGALIIDNKLFGGASGCAGDIGHYGLTAIDALNGPERHNLLDGVASRSAMAGEAAMIASKQGAPHLAELAGTDVNKIRGETLAKSIQKGDKKIEDMVRSRARTAGVALSNMVDFLNPNVIVLGGGLVDALPALFLQEVEAGIRKYATAEAQKPLKVVVSKFKDHVVTIGTAKMAWDRCAI